MEGGRAIAAIGECMVELVDHGPGDGDGLGQGWMRRGFGGDTLNTSVYLARLGVPVAYVTQLGDDGYSEEMLRAWHRKGWRPTWPHARRARNRASTPSARRRTASAASPTGVGKRRCAR